MHDMEVEVVRGMTVLVDLIKRAGCDRRGAPIKQVEGDVEPRYVDDRRYAFAVQ